MTKYQSDRIGEIYKRIQSLRAEDVENSRKFSRTGTDHDSNVDHHDLDPSGFGRKSKPQTDIIEEADSQNIGQSDGKQKVCHSEIDKLRFFN